MTETPGKSESYDWVAAQLAWEERLRQLSDSYDGGLVDPAQGSVSPPRESAA